MKICGLQGRAMVKVVTGLVVISIGCSAEIDTAKTLPDVIQRQVVGELRGKNHFHDAVGTHFCILMREHLKQNDGKEQINLKVVQFRLVNGEWQQEWTIKDYIECSGLDIEGEFFRDLTAFSDIDSNGIFETTVAYQIICAGGVEPKMTKVIMRQQERKYAVRGESLVSIDENTRYGGTFKVDSSLDSLPEFKDFLVARWKRAAGIGD